MSTNCHNYEATNVENCRLVIAGNPFWMLASVRNFPETLTISVCAGILHTIYDHERKAMSDEESDSTGDHYPNLMTGYFLKHIICLC